MVEVPPDKVVHILSISNSWEFGEGEDTTFVFLDSEVCYDTLLRIVARVDARHHNRKALDEDVDESYEKLKAQKLREDDLMEMFGEMLDWSSSITWQTRTILDAVPGEVREGIV